MRAIFRCKLAVVDGLGAVVGSLGAAQGGLGTFIRLILPVARGAIPRSAVEVARRIVTRFGLTVSQPGCDVTVLRSKSGLPAAQPCQLVDSRVLAVPGSVCAIFCCDLPVFDRLGAVVCSPGAPGGGLSTFVCRMLTIARRAITRSAVEITSRVVARLGLSVTQPGSDVTILRGQAGLPAAHSCQLIDPGVFAVFGGLCSIFGCHLAVVDGLRAVVSSLSSSRGSSVTLAVRVMTLARRAVPRGAVEVTCRVVARFSLSVPLLGLSVTHVRSQVAVTPFYVALPWGCEGVLAFIGAPAVLIWACRGGAYFSHMSRFEAPPSRCGGYSFGVPP